MKTRLALLAAGSAALFMVGAAPASADNGPHVAGAGIVADGCAGCHRTHTAVAPKLLKAAMPGLCTTCHGATGTGAATDVVDGLGYATAARGVTPGALRGGGFSFALIDSANPGGQVNTLSNATGTIGTLGTGVATTSSHTVDGTTGTAWGNGVTNAPANSGAGKTVSLTCGSCHDPHGNGNYRILKPIPTDSGGTSTPIAEPLATAKDYTTTNYWKVSDDNTSAYIGNVSDWCTTCHTRYLADLGSNSANTDSGDDIFSYRHASNGTSQGSASCIQCHVSHGSNAAMTGAQSSVSASNPGTPLVPGGSSRLLRINNRGTCQMCHNK